MYKPTHKCPYCGSTNIYQSAPLSATAVQPYWHCNDCLKEFINAIPITANESILPFNYTKKDLYGWICPSCGVGVNPTEKTCPKCDFKGVATSIGIGTITPTEIKTEMTTSKPTTEKIIATQNLDIKTKLDSIDNNLSAIPTNNKIDQLLGK